MKAFIKLSLFLVVVLLMTNSARADYCLVTTERDVLSNTVQDALRWKLEEIVFEQPLGGCTITSSFADKDVADNYIAFSTPELSQGANVREIILSYDANGDGVAGPLKLKPLQSLIIGNPSNEAINGNSEVEYNPANKGYCKNEDGTICDAGFVVIDGSALNAGDAPFNCLQGASDVIIRNMLIATNGVSREDLFANETCLKDGGDVHVCNGALKKDADGKFIDPNVNSNWCDGSSGTTTEDCTDPKTWYKDPDGDGYYGANAESVVACENPDPNLYVGEKKDNDCKPNDEAFHPGAKEECGDPDYNCNDKTREGKTWYVDADLDTFGDALGTGIQQCEKPDGNYVKNNEDCNDSEITINPDATEICDGLDNNCDEVIDEGLTTTYYPDADGDTYGATATPVQACSAPADHVEDGTDCDDTNSAINKGVEEVCANGTDDNCDGTVDEASCGGDTDDDGDGYTETDGDCNDADASINPDATDICGDGIDQNCDSADRECDSEVCNDGSDNDEDGASDCDDIDCDSWFECNGFGKEEVCNDTIDNEGDGFTDCQDKDCMFDESCINATETSCNDEADNDGDLLTDCEDIEDCGAFVVDPETGTTCADFQVSPIGPGGMLAGGAGCGCDLTAHRGSSTRDAMPAVVGFVILALAGLLRARTKQNEIRG